MNSHIDEYVIKKHYIITNIYTKITKMSMYKTYIHTCYVYTPLIKDHVIPVKASYQALLSYICRFDCPNFPQYIHCDVSNSIRETNGQVTHPLEAGFSTPGMERQRFVNVASFPCEDSI